jgi:hypothetical protein
MLCVLRNKRACVIFILLGIFGRVFNPTNTLFSTRIPIVGANASSSKSTTRMLQRLKESLASYLGQPETSLRFPVIHKMKISLAGAIFSRKTIPRILKLKPIGQREKSKSKHIKFTRRAVKLSSMCHGPLDKF